MPEPGRGRPAATGPPGPAPGGLPPTALAASAAAVALLLGGGAFGADAQGRGVAPGTVSDAGAGVPWRFPVGERLVYDVTFGPVRVGRSRLEVEAVETVGGRSAYRVALELRGGPFFYRIDDRSVSWVAADPIRSLRFEQRLREGDYRRHRRYALDQEAGTYTRLDWDEEAGGFRPVPHERGVPMPPAALDEIAFLYLARSLPLEPGRVYRFDRYFEADGNPVVLEVLRRQTVRVPAGRFRTVVVRPIIRTGGMFGQEGRAEVFISDDDRRAIVLLRTRMRAGEVGMYLREYAPGGGGLAENTRDAPR